MKFIYCCVFILLISSCNNKKTAAIQEIEKPESSRVKKHDQLASIQSKFQLDIDTWKEYENLAIFLQQYTSISPNNALNNSRELNDIAKSLVDSLKPAIFETPAFNARVNLLYNETLRLYDMSSIPAIKANEVNNHIDKILNAFSSINSKINTTLKQRELELTVEDISFKKKIPKKKTTAEFDIKKFTPRSKKKTKSKGKLNKNFSKKSQKIMLFEEDLLEEKKNNRKRKKMVRKKLIKNISVLLIMVAGIYSCEKGDSKNIDTNKQVSTENIDIFLNDWHKAASKANYSDYFSKMDSISVFIGTDATENWSKNQFQKFSKPYFDDGKAWDFKTLERHIYTSKSGDFIWFDELLDTWMGVCRGSGVIEMVDGKLKIKHYVLSLTVPNDVIDEVIKINSNFLPQRLNKLMPLN